MWTVLTYAWCTQFSLTHLKHNAFTQVKPDKPPPSLPAPQLPMFSLQRKSALCRFVWMRSSLSMCKIALRRFAQECMSTVCANDLCRNMCHAHCALDNTYNYLQFKISRFCSIGSETMKLLQSSISLVVQLLFQLWTTHQAIRGKLLFNYPQFHQYWNPPPLSCLEQPFYRNIWF